MTITKNGKSIAAIFCVGCSFAGSALAQVDVYSDKATFEQLTGATAAAIPPAASYVAYPGYTDVGCAGEIVTSTAGATVTVTAPNATPVFEFAHGVCVIEPTATPYDAAFPHPPVARSIVGVGPDNYEVALNAPVRAIGFELIANATGQGTVTLRDANANIVSTHNFMFAPNTVAFVGFDSTTLIRSVLLTLPGGDVQDVGISAIELGRVLAPATVALDIKPGGFPNSINLKSNGVIPVAVLTTPTFNAASIDVGTVRFGSTGTEAAPKQSALEDVDRDGDLDRVFHFKLQDTAIQCRDTRATLTGQTVSGGAIAGTDSIRVLGCPG